MSPTDPELIGTPATGPWKITAPSAHLVQQHFVDARVSEINSTLADKYRQATIEQLLKDFAVQIKGETRAKKLKYCSDAYDIMTATLQKRDLTINFKSTSWFSEENDYDTYAQMYERAIDKKSGKMFLTDDDPNNPANVRAQADDRITFPQNWAQKQAPAQRGLLPGATQHKSAILSQMLTGAKVPIHGPVNDKYLRKVTIQDKDGKDKVAYESKNQKFNAKTKQVFTALNYGRRPHGSSTYYGPSYLVINPSFKVDALYFAGDTFFIPSADYQTTYQCLGAIYLKAEKGDLRQKLVDSCLTNMRLPDTDQAHYLVEAHIFSEIKFETDITTLCLQPSDPVVTANAQKFCRKWKIEFKQL